MNNNPGATIDRRIADLGAAIVERSGRLEVDISDNNEKIEELHMDVLHLRVAVLFVFVFNVLGTAVIIWKLL
jgi:hypothetical protein